MTADIHQLIAVINPDIYCEPSSRREVRRLLEAGQADLTRAYARAVTAVQLKEFNVGEENLYSGASLFDLAGQKHPCERHQLVLDSLGEAPERVYFTLLSLLDGAGWKLEKMSDALTASSGSSLGRQMEESLIQSQEHAARLFRAAHETLIRLLRNLATVGDMEDDRAPPDTVSVESTLPSGVPHTADRLHQIRRSLLISAIRSEIEELRAYARWLRPFMTTDHAKHLRTTPSPDLVNAFNTALFRVELLARNQDLLESEFEDATLPSWLANERFRRAVPVLVIEVMFRTSPEQSREGGYHHRGRIEITLTSYALRHDELRLLQAEREREDLRWMVEAVGVMDERTLTELENELNRLLRPSENVSQPVSEDTNPFSVLWGGIRRLVEMDSWAKREMTALPHAPLKRDSLPEQVLRSRALVLARSGCQEVFNRLKRQLDLAVAGEQGRECGELRGGAR